MLLLDESTLWEHVKRRFVWILLRKYLLGLVMLKIMLMKAPKKAFKVLSLFGERKVKSVIVFRSRSYEYSSRTVCYRFKF